jgi:hypothetical protein
VVADEKYLTLINGEKGQYLTFSADAAENNDD